MDQTGWTPAGCPCSSSIGKRFSWYFQQRLGLMYPPQTRMQVSVMGNYYIAELCIKKRTMILLFFSLSQLPQKFNILMKCSTSAVTHLGLIHTVRSRSAQSSSCTHTCCSRSSSGWPFIAFLAMIWARLRENVIHTVRLHCRSGPLRRAKYLLIWSWALSVPTRCECFGRNALNNIWAWAWVWAYGVNQALRNEISQFVLMIFT